MFAHFAKGPLRLVDVTAAALLGAWVSKRRCLPVDFLDLGPYVQRPVSKQTYVVCGSDAQTLPDDGELLLPVFW